MRVMTKTPQFNEVKPTVSYPELEEKILQLWRERNVFQRSMSEREGGPEFVFHEGPPTANGRPGIHHVLARAFKDIFPRYKTMQGYYIQRRGGWDTHGLPVEIEVEKKLGLTGKQQIEAYGIAKFNALCRESTMEYISEWEELTERMAFWVDLKTAYVTFQNEYIESLWWILKQFWEKTCSSRATRSCPTARAVARRSAATSCHWATRKAPSTPASTSSSASKDGGGEVARGERVKKNICWPGRPRRGRCQATWRWPWAPTCDYVRVRDVSGDVLTLAADLAERVLRPGFEVLDA
jgi:hypothetical protein